MEGLNKLVVLPEAEWKPCPHCGEPVPEFNGFSESLAAELKAIGAKSVISAIIRLRDEGCSFLAAQIWVHHHLKFCTPDVCTTPCPHCGKFLRTPRAKQCRFCGADWHTTSSGV